MDLSFKNESLVQEPWVSVGSACPRTDISGKFLRSPVDENESAKDFRKREKLQRSHIPILNLHKYVYRKGGVIVPNKIYR